MGFGRPNRSASGDQAAARQLQLTKVAEDQAQRDKIAGISEQLDEETRLRRKRFGSRMGAFGGTGGSASPIAAAAGGSSSFGLAGLVGLLARGLFR